MNYPDNRMYSWGLEFGMQPYDMPRRDILALSPMFGAPAFRWLPAKGKVATRFLILLTRVSEGFAPVDEARLTGGRLILEDRSAAKTVSLPCSRTCKIGELIVFVRLLPTKGHEIMVLHADASRPYSLSLVIIYLTHPLVSRRLEM